MKIRRRKKEHEWNLVQQKGHVEANSHKTQRKAVPCYFPLPVFGFLPSPCVCACDEVDQVSLKNFHFLEQGRVYFLFFSRQKW